MGSISHHIMPLVINSVGVDTHTHIHTHMQTHTHANTHTHTRIQTFADKGNTKKPGVCRPQAGACLV